MNSPDKLAVMSAKLRESAAMLAEAAALCREQAEEACRCSGNAELEDVGRTVQAVSERLAGEIEALMQCADRVRRMDEAYRQVEMQVLDELMKKFG